MMKTNYDESFYRAQGAGSSLSAAQVVPLVMELYPEIKSVIDIGCGTGTWLNKFISHGVADCLGVDGAYVTEDLLEVPPAMYRALDLSMPFDLGRTFDLACSFEVAEHLPASSADSFVESIAKAAPVILFSAAIPGQGGTDHVNEQWQSYWVEKFNYQGLLAFDCIRPKIYGNPAVEWWYQQNIIMLTRPELSPSGEQPIGAYSADRVHPALLGVMRKLPGSGRAAMKAVRESGAVLAKRAASRFRGLGS